MSLHRLWSEIWSWERREISTESWKVRKGGRGNIPYHYEGAIRRVWCKLDLNLLSLLNLSRQSRSSSGRLYASLLVLQKDRHSYYQSSCTHNIR
jgi:hypothetical protein